MVDFVALDKPTWATSIVVDWMDITDLEKGREITHQQIPAWLKQKVLFEPDIEENWRKLGQKLNDMKEAGDKLNQLLVRSVEK